MGLKFRRSINLGSGIRVNLNRRSVGLSVGTRGARASVNSSGRVSTTTSIPGTGISHTTSTNLGAQSSRNNNSSSGDNQHNNGNSSNNYNRGPQKPPLRKKIWFIILMLIFFFPVGLYLMWKYTNWSKKIKKNVTIAVGIMTVISVISDPSNNEVVPDGKVQETAATETNVHKVTVNEINVTPKETYVPVSEPVSKPAPTPVPESFKDISYNIAEESDGSFANTIRKDLQVQINNDGTLNTIDITKLFDKIVSDYTSINDVNALTIYLYDNNDTPSGAYTLAMCGYYPKGNIGNASDVTSGDYTTFTKSIEYKGNFKEQLSKNDKAMQEANAIAAAEKAQQEADAKAAAEKTQQEANAIAAAEKAQQEADAKAAAEKAQQEADAKATAEKADLDNIVSYVASSSSDKYHYPSCRHAEKINAANLVQFSSIEDARNSGYTACGTCNPR